MDRAFALTGSLSAFIAVAGTLLFSGSLYLLALSGARWLGAITPLGGLCFLAGWGLLAIGIAKGGVQ